jgi:hypothetical protein
MTTIKLPKSFLKLLRSVKAKRPRTVIEHILKHGQITTQELKDVYGYHHPPRAIRDVREQGIPVVMFRVTGTDGRSIAAYKFGDPSQVRAAQLSGRTAFSSQLKSLLIAKYGPRCNIYLEETPERELQIDHRIPFEIAGDNGPLSDQISEYMLLCVSANRAKSWSCENCKNWKQKDIKICSTCYWAYPEQYQHIALREIRRLDVMWVADEIADYDQLIKESGRVRKEPPDYVKAVLRDHFNKKSSSKK